MDAPPPADLDVYALIEDPADGGGDERDDGDEDYHHEGKRSTPKNGPEHPARSPAPKRTKFSHRIPMHQRLLDFCFSLLAPPRTASPEELRRHAITLSLAVALIYAHIAIACGWATSIGLSGFARADSTQATFAAMQADAIDDRLALYGLAIRDLHSSICAASSYRDTLLLNSQLQDIRAKYEKITGVPYLLPECPEKP